MMRHPHPRSQDFDRETWIEPEELTYPSGGFRRRAAAILRRNPHNPIELPYDERRIVRCAIADTFSTIPARLTYAKRTIRGFLSVVEDQGDRYVTFTPEAPSERHPCAE